MLVVLLRHCQAYYDFPHCDPFHGGEPTVKGVAVRKLRRPYRTPVTSGPGDTCRGAYSVPPVCMHPSFCTA